MKRLCIALALAPLLAVAQPYPEVQRSSFYVTVRDGTRLAMDLYRPMANGQPVATPLPVIWYLAVFTLLTLLQGRLERHFSRGHSAAVGRKGGA